MTKDHFKTIIVGAGLAGLNLGRLLEADDEDYLLLEARTEIGGRVLSTQGFDLGPSWFWPGQHRTENLTEMLDLQVITQFQTGDWIYDDGSRVRRIAAQPQQTSYRIDGGMAKLANGLAALIPPNKLRLNSIVRSISLKGIQNQSVAVQFSQSQQTVSVTCDQLVLTLPPRLVMDSVSIEPELSPQQTEALCSIPTWMASHAKVVVTYPAAFWRDKGLSGDAFSQTGPLGEIHDASTDRAPALFGFFNWDSRQRQKVNEDQLKEQVLIQLGELFGEQANSPTNVYLKDWSRDNFTATTLDQAPLNYHPTYSVNDIRLLEGPVILAGTETSLEYGGFIEGALASAERAYQLINNHN